MAGAHDRRWSVVLAPDSIAWYLVSWKSRNISSVRVKTVPPLDELTVKISEQVGGRDGDGNDLLYVRLENTDPAEPALFHLECEAREPIVERST